MHASDRSHRTTAETTDPHDRPAKNRRNERVAYETCTRSGFDWQVNRACRADVERLMEDPDGFLAAVDARVIKHNNVRTVFFLRMGERDYYLKQYRQASLNERLKARWLESKAAHEWRIMRAGREAGLPVPEPAVVGERWQRGRLVASFLASVSIPRTLDLVPYLAKHSRPDGSERHAFLERLGREVWRLHAAGLLHRDMHSGNVLVQEAAQGEDSIHFIDLHRGSLRRGLGLRVRRANLAFLLHSTSSITTPADRGALLQGYLEAAGPNALGDPDTAAAWIEACIRRLERRRLRSRTRRCVVGSSQFALVRDEAGLLHVDRSFGATAARTVLNEYRTGAGRVRELKRTRRTRVARVDVVDGRPAGSDLAAGKDGATVVVKEYFPRPLDGFSGGRGPGAWQATHGLRVRGIPTVLPLAYLRLRRGGGLLVMSQARGQRLDHHLIALAEACGETSRAFRRSVQQVSRAVADLFQALHESGVYHGDLKACNLFVHASSEGAVSIQLIDNDRVAFPDVPLGEARRVKNLAQLHASVPRHVNRAARVRWFRAYATPEMYRMRRRYFAAIQRACARKIVVDREPIE